jgi:hypothetical protein
MKLTTETVFAICLLWNRMDLLTLPRQDKFKFLKTRSRKEKTHEVVGEPTDGDRIH